MQYIPYKSIKDQHVRDYVNKIKEAMVSAGMKPVGKYRYHILEMSSVLRYSQNRSSVSLMNGLISLLLRI